ncbi:uncharacterized protein [Aquarana catesbeiana]|uniref:uncharacterized protein isoform X1 n=1 Tax=Aquarana catesbeiana TaxID=8400 RepID=UPI003CC934EC
MTTRRQVALQPTAGRGRKSTDGIKAYLSPLVPEQIGKPDIKKRNITGCAEIAEQQSRTRQASTQMTSGSVVANDKRSPTAGRGRKTPEPSPPGSDGSPKVMGAKNKGQLIPGKGDLTMDIQSPLVESRDTMRQWEDSRWPSEEAQSIDTETMMGREGGDPIPDTDQSTVQEHPEITRGDMGVSGLPQRYEGDQESTQDGEGNPQEWDGQKANSERNIWELLKALPTKNDIQQLIKAVEQSCMQAVASLKEDIRDLGHRVEVAEKEQETITQEVVDVQESIRKYEEILNSYREQLDEYENRDRRQNIRIKGLKESITAKELAPTAQKIFGQILGAQAPNVIEIDRVHRVPLQNTKTDTPRDVICKIHKYTVKENIMKTARNTPIITFEGSNIALYPDISKRTLFKRGSVRPLLEILRKAEIKYRWGFPFSLTASRGGKTATLRTKDDLKSFTEKLDLPMVDFMDWRINTLGPPPATSR